MTMMISCSRPGKRIFFLGDSLSSLGEGNIPSVYRMPVTAYNALTKNYNISGFFVGVSGAELDPNAANSVSSQVTKALNNGQSGDIAVIWAGTNDISIGGFTAQQTYDNLCTQAQLLRDAGMKVIAVTMIAKNRAADADPAAIEVTRLAYNALIRGGSGFVFDAIADPGARAQFDSIADTADTTYYNADAVHLTTTGYDLIGTSDVAPAIQTLL